MLRKHWFLIYVFLFPCLIQAQETRQIDNAVILLYHHVSASTPASTSISPTQFKAHMDWLKQHHQVLPLTDIVNRLQRGQTLPDKAVAITFDDGYANILQNAHPILKEYEFSYTIFINPNFIGKQSDQLTWEQVKQMHREGVIFANHSSEHKHLLTRQAGESELQWLDRTLLDIRQAEAKLKDQLGYSLQYLAYPYGEYNLILKRALTKLGYVGFGQQSGALASCADFGALPRFPAAGIYANLTSLKTKLDSLAMPVTDNKNFNPEFSLDEPPNRFELMISSGDFRQSQLSCFFRNKPTEKYWDNNKLEIRIGSSLSAGRARINCTAPSKTHKGRFYWHSIPIFIANADGQWLD